MSRIREAVIIAMACLAPWAFGSVEAWAQLGLFGGIALVTILGIFDRQPGLGRRLLCLPSLALLGLALLALLQASPLPEGMLERLSPSTAALRADLLPEIPERVAGDPSPPVPLPPPTLSQLPHATLQAVAWLAAAWLLFQAVLGLGGGHATFRRFGLAIAANAGALSLFSLVQSLTWNGQIYWVGPPRAGSPWSVGGPFVCHSHLAEYLNLGLGFALGFLLTDNRLRNFRGLGGRAWAAYAAGVIAVGIVTSHSRGGFLAMLGALAVTLILMRTRSMRVWAGVAALLTIVGLLLLTLGDSSTYQQRIATIGDLEDAGYTGRAEIRAGALRAWRDHPFWGTGLGSFAVATTPYYDRATSSFFARAENEYVDLLTEGGVLGLGLGLAAAIGIGRLTRRSLADAPTPGDRGLVYGGIFGLVALALHSMSDFGLHVPGVAVPAVILAAHLSRLGLRAVDPAAPDAGPPPPRRRVGPAILGAVVGLSASALGVALVVHGERDVRVESLLTEAGLPAPGASMPTVSMLNAPDDDLERMQGALEAALRLWPDWAEGHLRLGMVHLARYKRTAAAWIGDEASAEEVARMSDPLWLFGVVHDGDPPPAADLIAHAPIRQHLVPATRSFLEARRCCPVAALAHARLASLDYLLEGGAPSSSYGARALALAGNDGSVLLFSAYVAAQGGDLELAALCWRRALEIGDRRWQAVADTASAVLSPDQLLEAVVPDGRHALRFADRLYEAPERRDVRDRFLKAAAEWLPKDHDLEPAERLSLEARAWAGLDRADQARDRMEAALVMQPLRSEWRGELIDWLLRWDLADEAHRQALVWLHFAPDDPAAQEVRERTAEAVARGGVEHRTGSDF